MPAVANFPSVGSVYSDGEDGTLGTVGGLSTRSIPSDAGPPSGHRILLLTSASRFTAEPKKMYP
eukprot:scaffold29_cov251-Pinguiococcus_pyrenoidosus.AAC.48